jgi:hypothetical protein
MGPLRVEKPGKMGYDMKKIGLATFCRLNMKIEPTDEVQPLQNGARTEKQQ